jgi:adenylate kinase family enzyme
MRLVLLGNAGAGKSSLARRLQARQPAERLSLDAVAFEPGSSERRPLADSVAAVRRFIAAQEHWILEGCYADILEPVLEHAEELIFLNPGVEVCVAHCRARPFEPEKFATPQEQQHNLENLIAWVSAYPTRDDAYGLLQHRRIYDGFSGRKRELTHPEQYSAVLKT